jgi:3-oxo-5-alpha-steroid 4-dehydrogenase 3 / polyprenol reductase
MFRYVLCPHYTAECVIYLILAFLAAPGDEIINKTLLTTLIFVAANLGHVAEDTRRWSISKFGAHGVAGKWRMIPFIW